MTETSSVLAATAAIFPWISTSVTLVAGQQGILVTKTTEDVEEQEEEVEAEVDKKAGR